MKTIEKLEQRDLFAVDTISVDFNAMTRGDQTAIVEKLNPNGVVTDIDVFATIDVDTAINKSVQTFGGTAVETIELSAAATVAVDGMSLAPADTLTEVNVYSDSSISETISVSNTDAVDVPESSWSQFLGEGTIPINVASFVQVNQQMEADGVMLVSGSTQTTGNINIQIVVTYDELNTDNTTTVLGGINDEPETTVKDKEIKDRKGGVNVENLGKGHKFK